MRYRELIEGKNIPAIIVDVQPSYSSAFNSEYEDSLAIWIANHKAPILMLVNADETGMTEDNVEHDIFPWWEEIFERNGLDFYESGLNKMEFFDKGYGYFRGAMDQGVDDATMVKLIREMYQQKINDSRELFDEDYDQIVDFVGDEVAHIITNDAISVEWLSVSKLKEYAGYITGGGRTECLKEVQLLMNAFNIKYKEIDRWIYG